MKRVFLLLLLITLVILKKAVAQAPVAYYPFTGNANDAVGSNHGTVNGATLTADRFGNANSAYSFDGVNDKITAPIATTVTNNFSLTGWVKVNSIGTDQVLFYNGNSSLNGYGFYLSTTGTLYVLHGGINLYSTSFVVTANQWIFLAMVHQSGNTKVYVNGAEVYSNATSTPNVPGDLFYMSSNTIGTEYFNGSMDEIKIFSTALTPAQVLSDFNSIAGQNYQSKTSDDWSLASTWEVFDGTSFVPATSAPSSADGVITIRSGHTVTVNSAVIVDQLVVDAGGSLIISNGNFTLVDGSATDLTVNGTFTLSSTLLGNGTTAISSGGHFNWINGNFAASNGSVTIEAGATSTINGSNGINLGRTLTNNGTITWQGGNITSGDGGSFINNNLINVTNDVNIFTGCSPCAGLNFTNTSTGVITKSGGSGTSVLGNFQNITFTNDGILNINSGTVALRGQGNHTGQFNIPSGNSLRFESSGGIVNNFNSGSALQGSGSVVFTNGTMNFNIGSSYAATLATNHSGGFVFWNMAAVTINDFTFTGGREHGSAVMTFPGNVTWGGGEWRGDGTATFTSTANVSFNGSGRSIYAGRTIINNGVITWSSGDLVSEDGGSLTNNHIINITNDVSINTSCSGCAGLNFTNTSTGVITKSGGSGTSVLGNFFNISISNSGQISVNSGTIASSSIFNNNGSLVLNGGNYQVDGGVFNNNTGAFIKGNNVFTANSSFSNNGTLSPGLSPGILTMNGLQPISASSTLQIEILDGSGPGTGHDQLVRAGNLTLAGTLTVTTTNAVPVGTYTIINLTSGTISGSFATVNIPQGTSLQINSTNVQLIVNAVLPLNLLSFTGSKQNNDALLQWKTANEINVSHFEIQRSNDGQTFTSIGTVAAGGSFYSFTDANTFSSRTMAFYRLKSIDTDARFTYSNIIKLSKQVSVSLTVFPNPVSDVLTIAGLKQGGSIRLFTADGKLLKQQTVSAQTVTMDMSKYAKGIYWLQYQYNGETVNQKISKN